MNNPKKSGTSSITLLQKVTDFGSIVPFENLNIDFHFTTESQRLLNEHSERKSIIDYHFTTESQRLLNKQSERKSNIDYHFTTESQRLLNEQTERKLEHRLVLNFRKSPTFERTLHSEVDYYFSLRKDPLLNELLKR